MNRIFKEGGGAGVGSRIIPIVRQSNGTFKSVVYWPELIGSFENVESLYLSIVDGDYVSVVTLEGKNTNGVYTFYGVDDSNNKGYIISQGDDNRIAIVTEYSGGGGGGGGDPITIDPELDPASKNPVENAAIYTALAGKITRQDLDLVVQTLLSKEEVTRDGLMARKIKIQNFELYQDGDGNAIITASKLKNAEGSEYATQADVQTAIDHIVDEAPEAYRSLRLIAEELKDKGDVITAILTAIGTKVGRSELSRVAITGDYSDLLNTPIFPDRTTPVSYFVDDGTYLKPGASIFDKLASKDYVNERVKVKFRYKGKVQTYDDLPADGMQNGDFYWVIEPKEEGGEPDMSYIWQEDEEKWVEFMPMSGGGGGGETSIIHVDELPEVDQELDKLYQITKPKFFTNIYGLVQGFLFKNELRIDGGRVTAKVIDVESLDILDASPIYKEWYDQSLEEGGVDITVYRYDGQIYY